MRERNYYDFLKDRIALKFLPVSSRVKFDPWSSSFITFTNYEVDHHKLIILPNGVGNRYTEKRKFSLEEVSVGEQA